MVGSSTRNPRTPSSDEGGNPWVKSNVMGEEDHSCYNPNFYKNKYAVEGVPTGNVNHVGDYYICGDKEQDTDANAGKCKVLSHSEWITTVKNCKQGPNKDQCYNMATQDTPGVNVFHMGGCSDSSDVYNPETNTGGKDGCFYGIEDGTTPDAHGETDDYETCMRDTGNESQWCGIGPVNGVRPAYPTAKGILTTIGGRTGSEDMSGVGYVSGDIPINGDWNDPGDLYNCPSTHSESLHCFGDGYGGSGAGTFMVGGNAPGCGMGDDNEPDGSVRFCKRPTSDFDNDNITKCCLGVSGRAVGPDGETSSGFKGCPRGYCRSEIKMDDLTPEQFCEGPVTASKGADGEPVCYMMSDKCNDHFDELCDADVFLDPAHKDHKYCNTWALAMPEKFEGKASEVCSIPVSEDDEELNLSKDPTAQNELRKIFTNRLCREWIIKNYDINISKIREICKFAVEDKGELNGHKLGWRITPLGEILKDICPCHYPQEYYEWYKEDKFNSGEVMSNLGAQIKPECFSPECQRTLLYPSDENPDCPSLQICRQSIENNIITLGERDSDKQLGMSSSSMKLPSKLDSQVCKFTNTQSEYTPPPIPTPDGYSGGPDDVLSGGSRSALKNENRASWDDDDDDDESDNTVLIVGVSSVVLILIVVVIIMMMKKNN